MVGCQEPFALHKPVHFLPQFQLREKTQLTLLWTVKIHCLEDTEFQAVALDLVFDLN